MQAREGDLIKTRSNVIFDVKGLVHPEDKIIAFPRFIPSKDGIRKSNEISYGKVYSLSERFTYLQAYYPDLIVHDPVFGETLCEVPINQIYCLYQPAKKLAQLKTSKDLTQLEEKALRAAAIIREEARIPWSAIGISGSIMAGLTTSTSDIDPIVYGIENSRKAYSALQKLCENDNSGFKAYTIAEMKSLYDFRSKDTKMSFLDFQLVENRKAFQGMFMGVDYFFRFLKDWNEVTERYGDFIFKNVGYGKIQATVDDDSDALYTPCSYKLAEVKIIEGPKLSPIKEVVSFRGRFCQQAVCGERIEAQGKIELVTDNKIQEKHYRLILGNKPEDYMILKA